MNYVQWFEHERLKKNNSAEINEQFKALVKWLDKNVEQSLLKRRGMKKLLDAANCFMQAKTVVPGETFEAIRPKFTDFKGSAVVTAIEKDVADVQNFEIGDEVEICPHTGFPVLNESLKEISYAHYPLVNMQTALDPPQDPSLEKPIESPVIDTSEIDD